MSAFDPKRTFNGPCGEPPRQRPRDEVEAFDVGCAVTLQTLASVLKAREHGARYAVRPARGRTPERC